MKRIFLTLLLASLVVSTGCNQNKTDTAVMAALQDGTPTIQEMNPPVVTTLPSPSLVSTLTSTSLPPSSPQRTQTGTPSPDPDSPTPANLVTLTALAQSPQSWQSLPVVPQVSGKVKEIYQRGLSQGNNPLAFSKIGDCGSTPAWFLGDFDRGPQYYRLGEHQNLLPVIEAFQRSYGRTSLAAKAGFNASSVLTPLWSNPALCESNETPLACEIRQHRPMYAFITLGSNDIWRPEVFEPQMRNIIEQLIANGVIPILSTKADDLEGDGSLNATIARLAVEYEIPLWNYWLAVQPLPSKGLQTDSVHITWAPNRFDDPQAMQKGWPVRNLTALQVLDAVWRVATDQETGETTP